MQAPPTRCSLTLESGGMPPESDGAWPDLVTKALVRAVARTSPFAVSESGPDCGRLRAQAFRVMVLRPLQGLLRRARGPERSVAAVLKPILVLGVAVAAFTLPIDQARAQEALQMSATERSNERSADSVALTNLGLDLAAIDACEDAEGLWRAVRELVLPGRVAPTTQQRILRRLWAIDPDIRAGSVVESTVN